MLFYCAPFNTKEVTSKPVASMAAVISAASTTFKVRAAVELRARRLAPRLASCGCRATSCVYGKLVIRHHAALGEAGQPWGCHSIYPLMSAFCAMHSPRAGAKSAGSVLVGVFH